MKRNEIAPGVFITEVPGEKFKRSKITMYLVVPGEKESATALAILPHVLSRRCAAVPDPIQLSRRLFSLYGADLSCESYVAGASRVVSISISGLKNAYALNGEDLAGEYLNLLCQLLFYPMLENGAFMAEDVEIEKVKQADYLKCEMNDKRGYCLRQARRRLFGSSPLGIESAGYLEDIPAVDGQMLAAAWKKLLATAQVEVYCAGVEVATVSNRLAKELGKGQRNPLPVAKARPIEKWPALERFEEPMPTTQGKLCIMVASGQQADGRGEMVMRLASALYGGLPTSRLFMNVREKQSLCYYCGSGFGFYSGTLTIDSGVDHSDAARASKAILHELEEMQQKPVSAEELQAAKSYLRSVFTAANDSPDALINLAFVEWLKGTGRSAEEMLSLMESVTADEIQQALAAYQPALEYVITQKEGD